MRTGRNRLLAVMLSGLACPGAGQIYKRHYVRGALLVAASLVLVAAIVAKTVAAMMGMLATVPPEQAMMDAFGIAHRIMESESAFFTLAGYAFLALWVYGVLDAAITRPRA